MSTQEYTWYVGDGEQTGPNTQWHSMHWFGIVKLTRSLDTTFESKMRPRNLRDADGDLDENGIPGPAGFHPESMKYNGGVTWAALKLWPKPALIMPKFLRWIETTLEPGTKPLIITDNTGHDKKWFDIYVDEFIEYDGSETPLGHSSQSLKDRFNGFKQGYKVATGHDVPEKYRSLEEMATTKHNHTPLDDALGRAEAMLVLSEFGFPITVH